MAAIPPAPCFHSFFLSKDRAVVLFASIEDLTSALLAAEPATQNASIQILHFQKDVSLFIPAIRQLQAKRPAPNGVHTINGDAAHLNNPTFTRILRQVQDSFTQDLSLQGMSEKHNLNYTYLSELFRQALGVSFKNYVAGLRMAHACQLLSGSKLSISDVGEACSFNSYPYFNSQFKKKYGITPAEYRKAAHTHE